MKGKWTEIFTRREKDIPGHYEASEGRDHGQGWACTCGCNKRIHGRKHSEGPPRDECADGFVPTSGGTSEAYRKNYDLILWDKYPRTWIDPEGFAHYPVLHNKVREELKKFK